MVAKDRAIRMGVLARYLSGVDTKLVGQLHNNISGYLEKKSPLQRWLRTAPMRWLFPAVNWIICVSEGVVDDTVKITGLPRSRMVAIRNPIITPDIYPRSQEPVDHPWFAEGQTLPVIVGAGRLTPEKDFATLIKAFQRLRQQRDCRLLILGEGPLRKDLEGMIAERGLADCVSLVGYQANPFAYMSKASLFVLSSAWEGSGNVLVEALALGIPSVSTNCPYGPSETLADGKYGPLVPVGDDAAMARAMLDTLNHPLPANVLQEAVVEFSLAYSTQRYLAVLGFAG
jgi:glycosyltransferase involved in cell wall biosynthesis